MSDSAPHNERRRHAQRIKLGIIVACTPWLLLGLLGLVAAGVTSARAARLPLEELRSLSIATLAVAALVSLTGMAIAILGGVRLLAARHPGDAP
ncbi:MAG: hypothetical protein AAFX79_00370 [Planctomycetota bacterium]